ncbi:MAG: hypothetical protein ACFFC7_07760 [Candidatus Hermodarchaeota archaeon]
MNRAQGSSKGDFVSLKIAIGASETISIALLYACAISVNSASAETFNLAKRCVTLIAFQYLDNGSVHV